MGHIHPSTPAERTQWAAYLLAHQHEYGVVSQMSRTLGVSRPTLYAWRNQAQRALETAFGPPVPVRLPPPALERQVLTVLLHGHASVRGIQYCVQVMTNEGISLATITTILHDAQQRAMGWMHAHVPPTMRALALDEIYATDRCGAYLNVVDVHSGAVWASEGPLAVDTESWTLVLWSLHDRRLRWDRVVMDGGAAMRAACRDVTPDLVVQGDQWHLLRACTATQGRVDRHLREMERQTVVVARQAARCALGQRPRGRSPKSDVDAHAHALAVMRGRSAAIQYLLWELHRLLDVVVIDRRGVLDAAQRQEDLDSLVELLAEVARDTPAPQQALVEQMHRTVRDGLDGALTFVPQVAQVQEDLRTQLPMARQALLGWAWLRRRVLGWRSHDILTGIPEAWRTAARVLLETWDKAVRVSTAVERWHSILRPHLTVHRRLTSGMLALIAVWHNHRVFTRGAHKGQSPLHLSGMVDAPSDWLVALGYPPADDGISLPTPAFARAA